MTRLDADHLAGRVDPRLSRRRLLSLGVGAFAVAALPLGRRGRRALVRRTVPVMGTLAEVAVVSDDAVRTRSAIAAAFDSLRSVERAMSPFRPDSDLSRVNRSAGGAAEAVSPGTAQVLAESLRWAEASRGAFDPCLGRAVDLWDVTRRQAPPSPGQVRRFAGQQLYRALELGRRDGMPVARLAGPEAQLDLGGIAKGYGVDRAVEILRAHGVERALVSAGGDLYALGRSEDGDAWQVGVRDPEDPTRIAHVLRVVDAGIATSGDYFRYFDHAGRRYHHLLDPGSGAPRRGPSHSVTVVADSCMQADAAATAVFGLARERAEGMLAACAPAARIAG